MSHNEIGWDADFYNSLPETTRNVSLSDREIYVLGNLLPMVSWRTRWSGDVSSLDIDAIRGEMEFTILDEIEVGEMSCEDIANCIETDETVQAAIENEVNETIVENGIAPNPDTDLSDTPPPTLKQSAKEQNLLPSDLVCSDNPQLVMGLARAIVKELHESAEDFFEVLELSTNVAEATAQAAQQIPMVGTGIAGAIEFVEWVLETMAEVYMAAYSQGTEDELSCLIFCHIMDTCSLSISDLVSIYESAGSITIPPIDDLDAVFTFAIENTLSPDLITVAIFHYQILRLLSWGSVSGLTAVYFKTLLNSSQASDYSYEELCDDCPQGTPETYWKLYVDFALGLNGWEIPASSGFLEGSGIHSQLAQNPNNARAAFMDLLQNYTWIGLALEFQARGMTGSASDALSIQSWTGANLTGTVSSPLSTSGVNVNENNNRYGLMLTGTPPTPFGSHRSLCVNLQNGGLTAVGTNFSKILKVCIIGVCNGTDKPPRSSYLAYADLPTTVDEMFE